MNFDREERTFYSRDFGETLDPSAVDENKMWINLLGVLLQGMPVPFNPVRQLQKIEDEEVKYGKDYSDLKKCCQNIAEIREVKHFRPIIFEVINRIAELGKLENRVKYYE